MREAPYIGPSRPRKARKLATSVSMTVTGWEALEAIIADITKRQRVRPGSRGAVLEALIRQEAIRRRLYVAPE